MGRGQLVNLIVSCICLQRLSWPGGSRWRADLTWSEDSGQEKETEDQQLIEEE